MSWALTVRPKSELKRMLHVATTQETLANTSTIGKISCRPRSQADMWSFQGRALLPSIVVSAEIRSKRLLMRDRWIRNSRTLHDTTLQNTTPHHTTPHHTTLHLLFQVQIICNASRAQCFFPPHISSRSSRLTPLSRPCLESRPPPGLSPATCGATVGDAETEGGPPFCCGFCRERLLEK